MNSPPDPERWSLTRWGATLFSALAIQGVLIFLFSDRSNPKPKSEHPEASVYYLGLTQNGIFHSKQTLARDPSLLTRPHQRSFTGPLWNQAVTAEREYIDWTEAPRYLSRTQFLAGAALRDYIQQRELPASVVSRSNPELSEAEQPGALPTPRTTLLFSGDIRSRVPSTDTALPPWPNTNVTQPTVIAVALDRFGWAQSTLIISNSLPQADQHALDWIRQTRFQALPPNRKVIDTTLTWGEITFRWATAPPSPENDTAETETP